VVYVPYEIGDTAPVTIKILDSQNREVLDVVDALLEPGRYVAAANISSLDEGTYSLLMVAGTFKSAKQFRVDN